MHERELSNTRADGQSSRKIRFPSKNRVMRLSVDAMKFGLESDLKIALTELRWIRNSRGELKARDFETVAHKYRFPIDFLKKGLKGFSFPDDYMISKSKWFPILYTWVVRDRHYAMNLFKLQFSYVRTSFWSLFVLCLLPVAFLYIDSLLRVLLKLDLLQKISILALPFVLSFIALFFELRSYIGSKKAQLDDYSTHFREMGLQYIIARNDRFIRHNYKDIVFAGNTLLRKLQSSPALTLFHMGSGKIHEQPTRLKETSPLERLLTRLHLLPKSSISMETSDIPVFYVENPYVEYEKRIRKLEEKSQ